MENNENLFISSELRTIQKKIQYEKESESVLKNTEKGGTEKGIIEKSKEQHPKIAEKVLVEKNNEKLFEKNKEKLFEKNKEKCIAETSGKNLMEEIKIGIANPKRIAEKTSEKILVEASKTYPLIEGGIMDIMQKEDSDDRLI